MTSTIRKWYEGPNLERTDSKVTVDTPNFGVLIATNSDLPDNPYTHNGEWKYIDSLRGNVLVWNGKIWRQINTYHFRPLPPAFPPPIFSWDGPNNALLEKVKTDSIGIMTMLAERKKTASLLKEFMENTLYTLVHWKKPAKVLQRWLKYDVVTKNRWATKKLHRSIARCTTPAEAWLEYRYAYRPLYHDICDALGAFNKSTRKQQIHRVNLRGEQFGRTTARNLGPINNIEGYCSSRFRYYIGARFRIVDPTQAALGNLASVGASMWDLIPLSFVVDWAFDISSFLDLSNATIGLEFVSGFRSLKTVHDRRYSQYTVDFYGGQRYVPTGNYAASWRTESFERSRMVSCPTPTIKVGEAAEIFKMTHVADILAIIRTIWMGKYRSTYYFAD